MRNLQISSTASSTTSFAAQSSRPSVRVASYRSGVSLSPIARKAQREAKQQQRQEQRAAQQSTSTAFTPAPPAPSGPASTSYNILEAFFYGRAFATTLSKRLGEAVVDAVAEVSKAAAERPQRIQEFQEEVALLARKEMAAAEVPQRMDSAALPPVTSASSSSTTNSTNTTQDVEALVDDLRAEIATTRAVLQLIKTGGKSGAPPGPPPPLTADKEKNASST